LTPSEIDDDMVEVGDPPVKSTQTVRRREGAEATPFPTAERAYRNRRRPATLSDATCSHLSVESGDSGVDEWKAIASSPHHHRL